MSKWQIVAVVLALIVLIPTAMRFAVGAGFYELSPLAERTEGASLLEVVHPYNEDYRTEEITHRTFDSYTDRHNMNLGYLGDWHSGFRIGVSEVKGRMKAEVGQMGEWSNFGLWIPGDIADIQDMFKLDITDLDTFSAFTDKIDVEGWINRVFGSYDEFRANPKFEGASSVIGMTTVPVKFTFDAWREDGYGIDRNGPEVNELATDRTVVIHGVVKLGQSVIDTVVPKIPQVIPGVTIDNITPEDVSVTGIWGGDGDPFKQFVDSFPTDIGGGLMDIFGDATTAFDLDLDKYTYLRNVQIDGQGSPLTFDLDIEPIWNIGESGVDVNWGPGAIFLDLVTQAQGNALDFWITVQLGDSDRNIRIACVEEQLETWNDADLYFEVHLPIMWAIRIEYGVKLPTGILPSMDWNFNDILDNWGQLLTDAFGEIGADIDWSEFESRADQLRSDLSIPDDIGFTLTPHFDDLGIHIPDIPPARDIITYFATDIPEFKALNQATEVVAARLPFLDGILFDIIIAAAIIVPAAVGIVWYTGRNKRKGKRKR